LNTAPTHIINGCNANDPKSQEQLYYLLYSEMMKVCMRYTNNIDDAAALYNEAMLKVFTKIGQYKYEGSFNGWVKRIVVNTCIDDCRKNVTYKKQLFVDEAKAEHLFINPEVYSTLNANAIMNLVMQLPKNTASVFNMFVLDGFKHNEIAEALGITEGTSKWHMNEARRLLKIKLDELN
jgi:RNA polymerase sigma-70 factor, ECF subfamily